MVAEPAPSKPIRSSSTVTRLPPAATQAARFGMFHRRIAFVGLVAVLAVGMMAARLWNLTTVEGPELREEAEGRLEKERLLPTVRGSIVDRKGRVLAMDAPSYDLAIEYAAIDGSWESLAAQRLARREAGSRAWSRMTRAERSAAVEAQRPRAAAQLDAVLNEACRLSGLERAGLDARIAELRTSVARQAEAVRQRQLDAAVAAYGPEAAATFQPEPIREERQPHVVVEGLKDETAFDLRRLEDQAPGVVRVLDTARRVHPWSRVSITVDRSHLPRPIRSAAPLPMELLGVADHILGGCRTQVWKQDLERRPFERPDGTRDLGGYRPGTDLIGEGGVEESQESTLRGSRGAVRTRLDTGEAERVDPVAGRTLELTIDASLQARVQAALDPRLGLTRVQGFHAPLGDDGEQHHGPMPEGTALASAAVVIDVDRGEVLAAASWPTLAEGERLTPADRERLQPGVDRAADAMYPPGSILKPLVYLAATTEGVFPVDGTVECTGHYFPNQPTIARCWIYRPQFGMTTHTARIGGPLDAEAALSRSCNIYFYTLAHKLGADRLVEWLRRFGLGAPLQAGLRREREREDGTRAWVGESGGSLPSESFLAGLRGARDVPTTIFLGIGQGPIAWSPLQAANAYALLAREGVVRDATFLRRPDDSPGAGGRRSGDLAFSPRAVQHMLEGLRQAVEESHGTGHHIKYPDGSQEPIFNVPGSVIRGKTGTAQASPLVVRDEEGGKGRVVASGDHAWFAGLVGDSADGGRPRYAIAVVVEYGGSGGKVAGPVAAEVVRALQAEGYLSTTPLKEPK